MLKRKGLYSVMALLIALSLMVTLVGCGGSEKPESEPAKDPVENTQPSEEQVVESSAIIEAVAAYLGSDPAPAPTIKNLSMVEMTVISSSVSRSLKTMPKAMFREQLISLMALSPRKKT